jgi:hypothetical protein|tara:strand:- start:5743 stop:6048 length:306 start_codon:yes stop_codon:yes gene_type:complete
MSFWAKISSFFERKTVEKADSITDKVNKEAKAIEKLLTESKEAVKARETKQTKPVRARTKTGKFVADDKSTEDVNEAWVGGKAPKKTSNKKPKVIRKKKSR